jgi:hypothetical protein
LCLLRDVQRGFQLIGRDIVIRHRPARKRLAPQAHGAAGIGGNRLVEGVLGIVMIEGMKKLEAVIKPLLRRSAFCGDGKTAVTHPALNRDPLVAAGNFRMLFHAADGEDGEIGFVRGLVDRDCREGQEPQGGRGRNGRQRVQFHHRQAPREAKRRQAYQNLLGCEA